MAKAVKKTETTKASKEVIAKKESTIAKERIKAKEDNLEAIIKALKAENKALKNTAFSEDKKEGVILQMIDAERKPQNLFVTHNKDIPGHPHFSVKNNKENAHIFELSEAKKFIKMPGQEHYVIVEL